MKVDKIDDMLLQIKKNEKYNEETSLILLLLGKPRMLFNPPIEKENLQKGKGWLSKKYYECEELFNAAKL